MNPFDRPPKDASRLLLINNLITKLESPWTGTSKILLAGALLAGVGYGFGARSAGPQFLEQYIGIMVVVMLLHGSLQKATNRRIALLLQLVRELEEKRESEPKL